MNFSNLVRVSSLRQALTLLCVTGVAAGCVDSLPQQEPTPALIVADTALRPSDAPMPSTYTDNVGNVWVWHRHISQFATGEIESGPSQSHLTDADVDAMSDEEFAEKMRPVRLINSDEYILASVNTDRFAEARAKDRLLKLPSAKSVPLIPKLHPGELGNPRQADISRRDARMANLLRATDDVVGSAEGLAGASRTMTIYFDPNDDRLYVTPTQAASAPYSASYQLQAVSDGTNGCSMTLIGPSTGLTAAHCVYLTNSGWYSTRRWVGGNCDAEK